MSHLKFCDRQRKYNHGEFVVVAGKAASMMLVVLFHFTFSLSSRKHREVLETSTSASTAMQCHAGILIDEQHRSSMISTSYSFL